MSSLLDMRLQFFADPQGKAGGGEKPTEIPEEYNDLVDGVVKKSNAKYLKKIDDLTGQIEGLTEQVETFKTKGMNAGEKSSYQLQKLQEELEKSNQTNKTLKAQITKGNITKKILSNAKKDGLNVSDEQLEMIVSDDEDAALKNYDAFKSFAQAQAESIKKQYGSVPPQNVHSGSGKDAILQSAKQLQQSVNSNGFKLDDIK